ncbi:MAG: hypothetical protein QW220_04905 [Candidatus Bathyarchaeia archaeon]
MGRLGVGRAGLEGWRRCGLPEKAKRMLRIVGWYGMKGVEDIRRFLKHRQELVLQATEYLPQGRLERIHEEGWKT